MIINDRYLPQLSTDINEFSTPTPMQGQPQYQPINIYQTRYTPTNRVREFDYNKLQRQLFEWNWFVKLPRKWTYTDFQYEHVGIPSNMESEDIYQSMNEWVDTTRTIADLVELHDEGKEFIITQPNDVERIFNIVQEYTEYVAFVFNTNLQYTYLIDKDPKVQELLDDVIKMQNLANRIFPVMVNLGYEKEEELTGLFGWLTKQNPNAVTHKLDFDPYEKYGFNRQIVADKQNMDEHSQLFKAVDISRTFNPGTFDKIRRYG